MAHSAGGALNLLGSVGEARLHEDGGGGPIEPLSPPALQARSGEGSPPLPAPTPHFGGGERVGIALYTGEGCEGAGAELLDVASITISDCSSAEGGSGMSSFKALASGGAGMTR